MNNNIQRFFSSLLVDNSNNQLNDVYTNRIANILERLSHEIPNINIIENNTMQNNTNQNIQNILVNSLQEKNPYKNVLSEEGKSQINFLKYKDTNKKIKKCPILQLPFSEEDDVAELPCNHIFDKESILQWLENESNKCPVCRYELNSKEKKIELKDTPNIVHPYGSNRDRNFFNFLQSYYERQEQIQIQDAIERSLLDLNNTNNTDGIYTDSEEDIPLFDSDIDHLL
jgi:hypothetical protein